MVRTNCSYSHSPTFQCPQQPDLKIPLSRLQDGICDCCDGVDEPVGLCEDICEVVLAEQRAAEAKARKDYEIGSAKRKQELDAFQVLVKDTLKRLHVLDQEVDSINNSIADKEQEINAVKLAYMNERREVVVTTIASMASVEGSNKSITGLFEPLTNAELAKFIVHTCQLNGEMADAALDGTCVPLRLAGVDVGLLWEGENFDEITVNLVRTETDEQKLHVAELVHKNAEGEMVWQPKDSTPSSGRKGRRRLEDYPGDDDYSGNDENDYDDENEPVPEEPVQMKNKDELSESAKSLQDFVEQSLFSRPRIHYLKRSAALVEKIDELMKDIDSNETETEIETSEEVPPPKELDFDPIAYRMTRNTLIQRQKYIDNGFDFAVSASILLNPIVGNEDEAAVREDLMALAGATLFHSEISSEHVWQILNYVVSEFEVSTDETEHTCASPLATLCPAKTMSRNGIQIPPLPVMKAGEAACEKAVDEASAGVCGPVGDEIPSAVSDGFFGYYLISPRPSVDPIEQAMAAFDELEEGRTLTDEALDQLKLLKEQRDSLVKEQNELDAQIGGRHESKFGPNGELFSFNNACHSVKAGKYEYEVCVFGKAQQKEPGSGGTSLGHWSGMQVDHETGDITFHWKNGAKCWNGPERSATVNLRCGAENKVLSAEEPDTCQYVLEMESHLACHELYHEKNLA